MANERFQKFPSGHFSIWDKLFKQRLYYDQQDKKRKIPSSTSEQYIYKKIQNRNKKNILSIYANENYNKLLDSTNNNFNSNNKENFPHTDINKYAEQIHNANVITKTADKKYVRPVQSGYISSKYFSSDYTIEENRRHLGVDIAVDSGTKVLSPVSGFIILDKTSVNDVMQKHLIISEIQGPLIKEPTREHVLGHINIDQNISEKLKNYPGRPLEIQSGQIIGSVADWGSRSHIHWGINSKKISNAYESEWDPAEGKNVTTWGWGRGKVGDYDSDFAKASGKGWIDMATILQN